MLHVADFSTVDDLPTSSPAAVDISAADILDVNGVPAMAGLPICCCWLHYFDKRLFCWLPCCVGDPVAAFNPVLIDAGVTAIVSITAVLASLLLLAFLMLLGSL